jgi:XTP/dITP diphosphohydrolase
MRLLIATKNPAKFDEMRQFLGSFSLVPLPRNAPDIAETGATFEENAVLKARAYFDRYHIATVADDGGLEIAALGGEPGVYSRRWPQADETMPYREKTDDELIELALAKLEGAADRSARLRVVGAYYDGTRTLTATAAIDGVIATERPDSYEKGYPFRSIFLVPQFGKLFRDLTLEEHEAINHRRAVYSELSRLIRSQASA